MLFLPTQKECVQAAITGDEEAMMKIILKGRKVIGGLDEGEAVCHKAAV